MTYWLITSSTLMLNIELSNLLLAVEKNNKNSHYTLLKEWSHTKILITISILLKTKTPACRDAFRTAGVQYHPRV
ncbi:MAG TPA: hypothetical protein PLG57_01970, partial [Bacteroidia bacterium]|nr:hypothetical protein [Bacteroidia bacterium]